MVPQRLLGKDSLWWFAKLGVIYADKDGLVGRTVRRLDATPGLHLGLWALRRTGIKTVARTVDADGTRLVFADGATEAFDAVIWTIGYRDDYSWIKIPAAVDEGGRCVERRGVSAFPGLFYVGRSWESSRASALLCGVADDAARIVDAAKRYVTTRQEPSAAR